MLVVFSFRAKPGKERELESLLNNPESGRNFAKAVGATRNTLFLNNGRMIRILEFPNDAKPVSMSELAEQNPKLKEFLLNMGPIIEDGFDVDVPGSLDAFNERITFNLAYDVKL